MSALPQPPAAGSTAGAQSSIAAPDLRDGVARRLLTLGLCSLLAGALLAACGGDDAAKAKDMAAAEAGDSRGATPGPGDPRADMPAPPAPALALNRYAEQCLEGELPTGRSELRGLTAACMESLLETLRAAIGTGEVPQAEVGPRLDDAEVAVRQLSIGIADDDLSARVSTAATSLVELAAIIGKVLAGAPVHEPAGQAAETEALSAAEGIDPGTPLVEQTRALARFLRTADGQVRPLVRFLSEQPPEAPDAEPAGM